MALPLSNNRSMPLRERCILETRFGLQYLWSRRVSDGHGFSSAIAQVHDGENVIADVSESFSGKRSQGRFVVTVYAPRVNGGRKAEQTRHSTAELAIGKMERASIVEWERRHGGC